VTDKKAPKMLSRTSYEGVAYCHQGWVLDKKNQTYLIMDDEFDEVKMTKFSKKGNPVSYIWDISNLEKPRNTGHYTSDAKSVDHNQYIFNGRSYQSNYGSGLRIVDVTSIPKDPTGKSVKEIGFFDVYPEDDNLPGGGRVSFSGSWSSYAGFKSGYIYVNTIERGGFVVKYTGDA
jgi:choice-of-anchor B domain-containing protein